MVLITIRKHKIPNFSIHFKKIKNFKKNIEKGGNPTKTIIKTTTVLPPFTKPLVTLITFLESKIQNKITTRNIYIKTYAKVTCKLKIIDLTIHPECEIDL